MSILSATPALEKGEIVEQMIGHALSVFMGFFAIMNPIANTPIFLGLTADDAADVRKQVAAKSLLIAFALIVTFALLGKVIFRWDGHRPPLNRHRGAIVEL